MAISPVNRSRLTNNLDLKCSIRSGQDQLIALSPTGHLDLSQLGSQATWKYPTELKYPYVNSDFQEKENGFYARVSDVSLNEKKVEDEGTNWQQGYNIFVKFHTESSDISTEWFVISGFESPNSAATQTDNFLVTNLAGASVDSSAISLVLQVQILSRNINKNTKQIENDEEQAIDLLFDFFVHKIADKEYGLVEDVLTILSPQKITNACALTVLHLTFRIKDRLLSRKEFYDEAYEVVKNRSGKEVASKLFDKLA